MTMSTKLNIPTIPCYIQSKTTIANHVEYFGHLRRFGQLGQRSILHFSFAN